VSEKTNAKGINKDWLRKSLLNTKQWVHSWYKPALIHEKVANFLQDESVKRGIITVPTQFGKTTLACQTFPAWYLANNPDKNIIVVSYNETMANKQSVLCRDFFLDPKFRELYPWLKLHPEQATKHEWRLAGKHRGGIIFTGKGGGIGGNPADILIIDDLYSTYEDALSQLQQEKDFDWFDNVCLKRLQDENSRVLIIGSRMVKNDLVGRLQAQEDERKLPQEKRYKELNLPAIINIKVKGDLKTGESAWPEKKSMTFLMAMFEKSPNSFWSMMMGKPSEMANQLIRSTWWKKIDLPKLKELGIIEYSVRGWDFGYSEKGNWTVGARIDVYEDNIPVLVNVIRWQADTGTTVKKIRSVALADGTNVIIGLEAGGTQIAMADRVKQERDLFNFRFVSIVPKKAKSERAMPWILKVQDKKFLLFPGPWTQKFLAECDDFSENCREDDMIDSVSTGWEVLYGRRGKHEEAT